MNSFKHIVAIAIALAPLPCIASNALTLKNETAFAVTIHISNTITANHAIIKKNSIILLPGSDISITADTPINHPPAMNYSIELSPIRFSTNNNRYIKISSGQPSARYQCIFGSCGVLVQNFPATYVFFPGIRTAAIHACTASQENTESITFTYSPCEQ